MSRMNRTKKTILTLSIALLSSMPLAAANINSNNYSTTLELIRSQNMDKLIDRVNALKNYVIMYMYQTGDIHPTTDKVLKYFKLPQSVAAGFTSNKTIQIQCDDNNYKITFTNLFSGVPSADLINIEEHSSELNPVATVSKDGSIQIPFDSTTIKFISTIKNLSPSATVVSVNAPSDITKIWYQPNGQGGFNVYQYSDGKWVNIGGMKKDGFVVNDKSDLQKLNPVVTIGTKAYVKTDNGLEEYVFDGKNWSPVGESNIKNLIDSSKVPKCSAANKNQIIYVKDEDSGTVKEEICDGNDWLDISGGGSGSSSMTPITINARFGTPEFDDAPNFKKVIGKNIPFCDLDGNCFRNWKDFLSKVDMYRIFPVSFRYQCGNIEYCYSWSYANIIIFNDGNKNVGKYGVYLFSYNTALNAMQGLEGRGSIVFSPYGKLLFKDKQFNITLHEKYVGHIGKTFNFYFPGNPIPVDYFTGTLSFHSFPNWKNIALNNSVFYYLKVNPWWMPHTFNSVMYRNKADIENLVNQITQKNSNLIFVFTGRYSGSGIWYVPKAISSIPVGKGVQMNGFYYFNIDNILQKITDGLKTLNPINDIGG